MHKQQGSVKFVDEDDDEKYSSTNLFSVTNAGFTLHDFSPIFHSPTGFDKSPTNARDRRQIGARSRVTIVQCELSKTGSEGIADPSPTPAKYLAC